MKKEYKQDLYGYLLERHYHKKQEKCYICRDDGQIDEIDLNLYFELNTEKELLFKPNIYKYIKSPILDVGCGAGRVAKNFQELGYKVVGIDISKEAISIAKNLGMQDAVLGSIWNFQSEPKFETVLLYGNNMGLAERVENIPKFLDKLFSLMNPPDGGKVIYTSLIFFNTDRKVHLDYHKFKREKGDYPGNLKLRFETDKFYDDWFEYCFIPPEDMNLVLAGTPYHIIEKHLGEASYIAVIEKKQE